MATLILAALAVARFGLRLVSRITAQVDDMAPWLAYGSGAAKGQVPSGLTNMRAVTTLVSNQFGSMVKLSGIVRAAVDARRLETAALGLRPYVGLRRRGFLVGSPALVAEGRHSAASLAALSREFYSPGVHGRSDDFSPDPRGDLAICAKMGTNALPPPRRSSPP